ncbi:MULTISPECIES: glycerol dehydrogenase [Clostridium]|uniref:glycerol dehydrogenase n=1 Tax=Clostridium TaxID=1485 RepID=UPI000773D9B7|nr:MULTISPECIES: glycerol dehydrogenase [Clostridium]AUM95821.1 glycerol dehydrogenase [Clostridium sporogenes]AVQ53267.1 glycerol dehydrogenase [Clostridium botulinum]
MSKIIISPSKYVQGKGELSNFGVHAKSLGKKFLIIASPNGINRTKFTLEKSCKNFNIQLIFESFNEECCKEEIDRLCSCVESNNCDVVVGIGGGKIFDTAKAVAYYKNTPVVIAPTVASTDAPCSALSVIYTKEGTFLEYLLLPKNPDLVLVDTSMITKAPARLLIAGMGDALATYFEARACTNSNSDTLAGGKGTNSAFALAKLCYETLLRDGLKAKLAVENKVSTRAVENIIEANTFLSGIGFESCGLAAAHAIHNGFTVLEECHHLYHGEKVAFGTLVQLVLENSPLEEIEKVIGFCLDVNLPITLEDMGIKEIKKEDIMKVAKATCAEGETIFNMPFEVTYEDVYAAIFTADNLANLYK